MDNIIVTAANSFIGYRLCRKLSKKGHKVYAVVRHGYRMENKLYGVDNLKLVHLDMQEYVKLGQAINEPCDAIFMLAWAGTRGPERDNKELQGKNYKYTMEAFDAAISLGCSTFFTAGSQAEYGPQNNSSKVIETDTCRPNTQYGIYKLKVYEDIFRAVGDGRIRLVEPRFFSLYGEDDSERTMLISTIDSMLLNLPCPLTKCIQTWDFMYIDDAVDGLISLYENEDAEGVFNFGYGEPHELNYYIEKMKEITCSESELLYGNIEYPVTGIVHTNPDIQKLRFMTGWEPETDFETGIKKVIAARKKVLGIY